MGFERELYFHHRNLYTKVLSIFLFLLPPDPVNTKSPNEESLEFLLSIVFVIMLLSFISVLSCYNKIS